VSVDFPCRNCGHEEFHHSVTGCWQCVCDTIYTNMGACGNYVSDNLKYLEELYEKRSAKN